MSSLARRAELKSSWRRIAPLLTAGLVLVGLVIATRVLREQFTSMTYADVRRALAAIPATSIALAVAAAVLSHVLLTFYDALGLRHIRHALPYRRTAFASFTSYVASHSIGLASLSGSAVRFRVYSHFGLKPTEIGQLIAFCGLTYWLGLFAAAGLAFVLAPDTLGMLTTNTVLVRWIGSALLGACGLCLLLAAWIERPLRIGSFELRFPAPRLMALQIPLGLVDWMASAAVAYFLLPLEGGSVTPVVFFGIYVSAQVIGMLSHVPGGVGVFESVALVLLPASLPREGVLGALVLYRIIYYVLPLAVALVLFAAFEVQARFAARRAQPAPVRLVVAPIHELAPQVFGIATFLLGLMLLLSVATPPIAARVPHLHALLPLGLIEIGAFGASLVGTALLILARGLQRRLRDAWWLAIVFAFAGAAFALLKGLDWEEALVMGVFALALFACRPAFYRRAALLSGSRSPGWLVAWVTGVSGALLVGIFAFKHVEFQPDLWWQFALQGNASRALRGLVGAAVVLAAASAIWLLRPAAPRPKPPSEQDLARAQALVAQSPYADAHLALTGDKQLLFSASGRSVLVFGVHGQTWIALGAPLGPQAEHAELIDSFRRRADWFGGRAAFDHVRPGDLATFTRAGCVAVKVGERGRIALGEWGLTGSRGSALRRAVANAQRSGAQFEVQPPGALDSDELRRISEAWLQAKGAEEKGFSQGFWDAECSARNWIACVRIEGRIVAFCNLWWTAARNELTMDWMRHLPGLPNGVMDLLCVELMQWGREQGFAWFDLGVTPLSVADSTNPVWKALAGLVDRLGGRFEHFAGLQRFKDKFDPEWEPVYLVLEHRLELPFVFADLAALEGRGAADG